MLFDAAPPGRVLVRRPLAAWRRRLQHVRRLGWGVADQAMSSVTNFVMVLYVAHTVGAAKFGAFSLAYVTYSFAVNASRGLASDPLMVRFSNADMTTWRRAVANSTGTATAFGFVAGAAVLVVAVLLGGTLRFAFLGLGLTLPVLMLQDSWRFSFFAIGRGGQAFLNDSVWAAALLPALVMLRAAGVQNIFWFVFAWGAAAGVAAVAGLLQARVAPRLSGSWGWLSEHRDLGYRYLAENTANSTATQLRTAGLGLIAGLAAVGYVQAAGTLMGPVMIVFMGMGMVGIPEAARILRRSPHRLLLFCIALSGGLAVVAVGCGAVLLVTLPRGLGALLLGSIWRGAYPLVLPYIVAVTGACIWCGATVGLHALGAARRSLRAMIVASAASIAGCLAGAFQGGALGSVCGLALATWLGAVLWWWELHAAMRESGIALAGDRRAEHDGEPAAQRSRHVTASGLAVGEATSLGADGLRQYDGRVESEPARAISATPRSGADWPTRPDRAIQPQPSAPRDPERSGPSAPPAIPTPSFTPTAWSVVVTLDQAYYDEMWMARALSGSSIAFPVYGNERRFPLAGNQMRIGRRSATRDAEPEIDLAGPPADPGVSRLHAVLIPAPDGSWAVLDPGSANGTLLNGRKIAVGDLIPLHDRDRINLGAWTAITVHCR
jgi:O-antigen/teichoic acid export membrane protein